jgi:DNA polymerase-3 subunit delta
MAERSPLKPVYLIFGDDRPKVRLAVARLRRRVVAESGSDLNVAVFDADRDGATTVIEAASTPSFVLGTRLILVANGHRWKAKDRQVIIHYLKDPMPDTVVAVEGETFSKDDALVKALGGIQKGNERVLSFSVPKRAERAGWVRKQAENHRLAMGLAEARHLIALSGEDPERLEREIEKLAAYCRGGPVTVAAIDAVCSPAIETKVFDLMDAVGHRDRSRAFRCLEEVFAQGEDPQAVFYALVRHVRLLEKALEANGGEQVSPSDLAKKLGVHPYTAKKLLVQRRAYDHALVGRALRALAGADAALRGRAVVSLESAGGVNHGGRFSLELALSRMLS